MKISALALFTAFALAGQLSYSQTADEVIDKYVAAVGGKDKLSNLKTAKLMANVEVGPNMKAPITMYIVNNKSMRTEFELQGMKMVQVVDGDSGWFINPFGGKKDPERMNEEQVKEAKDQMDLAGATFNYKSKGNSVELIGKEDMEGTEVYKLKITRRAATYSTITWMPTAISN
jgi:hypothetical protein